MLVLGRKQGERILIGDDIVITVVSAGGSDGVRIGIDAPRHVRIHRAEVLERVAASNQAAVAAAADTKATLPLLASKPATKPSRR